MGVCYSGKQKLKSEQTIIKHSLYSNSATFKETNQSKQTSNFSSNISFATSKKFNSESTLIHIKPKTKPILSKLIKKKQNKTEIYSSDFKTKDLLANI